MSDSNLFSRLPVLRLLLPLVVGIILHDACSALWLPIVIAALAAMVAMAMWMATRSPQSLLRLRALRYVPLALAMIAVGWGAAWIGEPVALNLDEINGKVACARVETIGFGEKSMTMQVKLLYSINPSSGVGTKFRGTHVMLSTRGVNYEMKAGDLVVTRLGLVPITNMGNPDEMDYARFMRNKGIAYRQHTAEEDVKRVGWSPTLMTRAFNFNQQLQHKVLNSTLSPATQAMVIAMLLGNDDFIDRGIRDEFSLSGVAHVLALSGLHVGIITLIIWFLLFPLDYIGARRLRLALTLAILIAYDVLTGMSPSVIRATVMMAFVFASMMFYRKLHPLNALATAALVVLVFSPGALSGVGFQLSFITVTAIIVFYKLFNVGSKRSKVLNYLYTTLATSVVAMLATIMLTAYYFNTISPLSVVTNFVLLPIIPVFMIVAVVALLLLMMGVTVDLLNSVLDALSAFINSAVGCFARLPLSSDNVYVTWVAVVIFYIVLVLLLLWFKRRNPRWLIVAGCFVVLGLIHNIIVDARAERQGLVIFNSYNSTPVFYFNGSRAMLWMPDVDEDFDRESFMRRHRAFLAHHGIDSVTIVDSTECRMPGGVIKPPYAHLGGTSLMAVGKGRWKHYERLDSSGVRFDLLVVTKRFHSQISVLNSLIKADTILFSGDIYDNDLPALVDECDSLSVPYYNVKTSGAYARMK